MKRFVGLLCAAWALGGVAETLVSPADFVSNNQAAKIVAGPGCLQVRDAPFYLFTAKRFPVKAVCRYVVRAKFRNPANPKASSAAFGVQMFDGEGKNLSGTTSAEIPETFTTLVRPVRKGDRTLRVADALYWKSGIVTSGAQADGGDFPNRNVVAGVKAVKRLAADDWEVELQGGARADVPAGTGVRL